ncbi:RNA polymerase sigma-70 factor [Glycomyces albidus]|uniref:RNA polymerase sigma-70 factor n=1 Tax=Glycomyces albidus TaxID=2656774 RepID=A0A6L5G7Z5_9ACTN|nr:RNA polymerase sigma-70 factor [Glycomyces albidus]MQM25757.1 RNA polymerase sigma-70 factor [Glycomyces albidus]
MATVDGEPAREGALDAAAAAFTAVRPRLFGIAYRMLGSASEAEDLVQEVWLRWQAYDRDSVAEPGAFLATVATRLSINALKSARARRETYVGPWLPEPVDTAADPYLGAERGEALEYAALLLMERLSPNERAAYVLREAFDYRYEQIAEVLGTSGAAVRQLVSRARRHIADGRRSRPDPAGQRALLEAFTAAARSGDLAALERLLAADVVHTSDGNGAARVARRTLAGAERVAKFLKAIEWLWADVDVDWAVVGGRSWAVLRRDGGVYAALTVDAGPGGIDEVLWLVAPEKLGAFRT